MCLIREAIKHSISRRTFLKGAGVLAATPLLAGFGGRALAASSPSVKTQSGADNYRTKLVLLGTAGGPFWWPDSNRVATSSALVVGDAIYLIDLGHGAAYRLAQAFNSGVSRHTRWQSAEGRTDFPPQCGSTLLYSSAHGPHHRLSRTPTDWPRKWSRR